MNSALLKIDALRERIATATDRAHKATHGQFMTPASVAHFMASQFRVSGQPVRIIDPGAGIGTLALAALLRVQEEGAKPDVLSDVAITAVESDPKLLPELHSNLSPHREAVVTIREVNFVEWAVNEIQFGGERFTHAILNPPYMKIGSHSAYRQLGRLVGIETVNLYSLFVALTIKLLEPGGELVAIIPRSFCNGPYYRPFRELVIEECTIEQIHLFDSRRSVFAHDDVLQENIIIHLKRGGRQGKVVVSRSPDSSLADLTSERYAFSQIVQPDDAERFFRIPTSRDTVCLDRLVTLADLGLQVSTGPVVDFRLREHLFQDAEPGTVPLLYPTHFRSGSLSWPIGNFKKANAIRLCPATQKWMFPSGNYVLTRRFSSKEERRRVMAHVLLKKHLGKYAYVGLENHFNVFHSAKAGIGATLARGLAAYLNSEFFDDYFRQFSGHTQVNATDLRSMPYPPQERLESLGRWIMKSAPTEAEIEKRLTTFL